MGGLRLRTRELAVSDRAREQAMIAAESSAHAFATARTHALPSPWQRARALLAIERADIGVVFVYAIASGLLSLATPVAVQALVNTVAFGSLLQPIVVLTLLLAVALAAYGTVRVLQVWTVETIMQRIFVRAVAEAGRRLARVDAAALDRLHAPDVLNRIFEIPPLQKALASLLVDGTALVLQTLVGLALLAVYHPLLLAFSVGLLVSIAVVFALGYGAVDSAIRESQAKYEAAGWLEHLARIPTLFRSASGRRLAVERTDEVARTWLSHRTAHFRKLVTQHIGVAAVAAFGSTTVLGIGGWLVLRQQLTLGQLVAAEIVVGALASAFFKLGKHLEAVYDVTTSSTKLAMLFDLPGERSGRERVRGRGPAALRLQQLGFAITGRRAILADVELELAPGEHVGILGRGGAGKSMLLDLVFGLRSPSAGRVLLDGLDLRQLDLAAAREGIVLVRDAELVRGTLIENLRLLAGDASLAQVQAAIERCGLGDTVLTLPDGLDTLLVPAGAPLSSSEARRVVLARALLARPRLLLLDGALDALGLPAAAQRELLDHVFADDSPWTAVVTTGDELVLARAPRALVLRDGTLQEQRV